MTAAARPTPVVDAGVTEGAELDGDATSRAQEWWSVSGSRRLRQLHVLHSGQGAFGDVTDSVSYSQVSEARDPALRWGCRPRPGPAARSPPNQVSEQEVKGGKDPPGLSLMTSHQSSPAQPSPTRALVATPGPMELEGQGHTGTATSTQGMCRRHPTRRHHEVHAGTGLGWAGGDFLWAAWGSTRTWTLAAQISTPKHCGHLSSGDVWGPAAAGLGCRGRGTPDKLAGARWDRGG